MEAQLLELEGTWEEIIEHADEFAGRRVRVTILPDQKRSGDGTEAYSTARSLLKHAGTWVGDDLEERLREVYETRSQARF